MFKFFNSSLRAAASVVSVPAAIAADVVTLGGSLSDKERPYTVDACSDLMKNVKGMSGPSKP